MIRHYGYWVICKAYYVRILEVPLKLQENVTEIVKDEDNKLYAATRIVSQL